MAETENSVLHEAQGERKNLILVADDDRFFLEVFKDLIKNMGFKGVTAQNGMEALEKLREHRPDIIITDVMMPGLNGFELTERIKQDPETTHIPVIIVTSLTDKASKIKGLACGADELLNKPIDETEFRIRVRNLLKVKKYEDYLIAHGETLECEVREKNVQLEEAQEKIKSSYLETVYRLTIAAEYRDRATGAHVRRIGLYSQLLAEKMGLDEAVVEAIFFASPMHDVGKIGIPDSVLLKNGRFTSEEFEVMKTHCTIGANILHNPGPDVLKTAMEIALTHHERWDGSGYPQGLSGAEIPLSGRITHIVDVYDALRSKRPYKAPFDQGHTLDLMENKERYSFDPEVFGIFMESIDEFKKIFEVNTG